MSKLKLDKYEKEILEAYDSDEFESILTPKRKKELSQTAENTFKKDKRINIRLSSRDLSAIQRKALEEGMPYQTLVSSVLHKYISGSLRDVTANK
jgi:predicted DNA binding CopG/RHH family protein